jgi:hypothetical protein
VRGNHPEVASRPFFKCIQSRLQVTDLGAELAVAFLELLILGALRGHSPSQAIQLAHPIPGEPNPVLEEKNDQSQAHSEPFHELDMLSDSVPLAKMRSSRQIFTGKASRPA